MYGCFKYMDRLGNRGARNVARAWYFKLSYPHALASKCVIEDAFFEALDIAMRKVPCLYALYLTAPKHIHKEGAGGPNELQYSNWSSSRVYHCSSTAYLSPAMSATMPS